MHPWSHQWHSSVGMWWHSLLRAGRCAQPPTQADVPSAVTHRCGWWHPELLGTSGKLNRDPILYTACHNGWLSWVSRWEEGANICLCKRDRCHYRYCEAGTCYLSRNLSEPRAGPWAGQVDPLLPRSPFVTALSSRSPLVTFCFLSQNFPSARSSGQRNGFPKTGFTSCFIQAALFSSLMAARPNPGDPAAPA